jgi:ribosomal protein L29
MAEAKKAPKKSVKKATEVKKPADLHATLAEKQQDLIDSRRAHRAGELVNPRVLGATRKDIARILTQINASKEKK